MLATANTMNAHRWCQALADHGADGHACPDQQSCEAWFDTRDSIDAIILEPPLTLEDDLAFVAHHGDLSNGGPASVVVLPDGQAGAVAEALQHGFDLPLTGPVDAADLAKATLEVINRQTEQNNLDGHWRLDAVGWRVVAPDAESTVPLTYKEREFLLKLADQPGQPVHKESFVSLFGTTPELFDPRRLEIMVRRLRNKVRLYTRQELPLHTAHGLGYALAAPMAVDTAASVNAPQPESLDGAQSAPNQRTQSSPSTTPPGVVRHSKAEKYRYEVFKHQRFRGCGAYRSERYRSANHVRNISERSARGLSEHSSA
jgi:DNA-binding response OmpR family regulator